VGLKLLRNFKKLWTFSGVSQKSGRFIQMEDLSYVEDATVLVSQYGKILWLGPDKDFSTKSLKDLQIALETIEEISFLNKVALPAFVESHTHLVFSGNRQNEFEMRNQGVSYQEISKKGGGILNTVKSTQSTSQEVLIEIAQKRVDDFIKQGVCTLEIKSGYGLDLKNEEKILRVVQALKGPDIVSTYLGAHALPIGCDRKVYENKLIEDLEYIRKNNLADRVDIFIEKNFFEIDFARSYLEKAKKLGFKITAHVEQLSNSGGALLALENGAQSIDHVIEVGSNEINIAANSQTTINLLPCADFYLKCSYPKAREMLDKGCRVSLATDFNPGSSPTQDLSFVGVLARLEMKMTLSEVFAAYTLNAAFALGMEKTKGSLEINKDCDFSIMEGDDLSMFFYSVGKHPVKEVWKSGSRLSTL
jgi:imidazolonepropionase